MKINFIVNEQDFNSTIDANILSFLFKKIKANTEIKLINVNNFKCENASINIFLGTHNSLLFNYAKCNIFIPDNHSFKKTNTYILDSFDYILCKSKYSQTLFQSVNDDQEYKDRVKFISWRSTDMSNNSEKDYNSFLLNCYDTKNTQHNKIIENWNETFPTLHVVNYRNIKDADNIIYHENISHKEFESLFNTCGFHLCLNEIDSFSHNVNQCSLSKSIPIILNGAPMNEIINSDYTYNISCNKKKQKDILGNKCIFSESNFVSCIEKIMNENLNNETYNNIGTQCRHYALKNHSMNDALFKEVVNNIILNVRKASKTKTENITEYPNVSVVTLVHNRKSFFNLSVYNYNTVDYDKDKIQWIVYDTSIEDEKVESLLPPQEERDSKNIVYIYDTNKMSIGEKRNKAVSLCTNDIVIFQDDDDYYYPLNVKNRVENLIHSNKKIVACTIIGSFNINKCISFIETTNFNENIETRIKIATLGFYKSVWDTTKFNDENINEAEDFIRNNINEFKEISWENVIVSLVHKYNTTNRITPESEPNGNHYGFSKGLFKYLLELQIKK